CLLQRSRTGAIRILARYSAVPSPVSPVSIDSSVPRSSGAGLVGSTNLGGSADTSGMGIAPCSSATAGSLPAMAGSSSAVGAAALGSSSAADSAAVVGEGSIDSGAGGAGSGEVAKLEAGGRSLSAGATLPVGVLEKWTVPWASVHL